MVVVRTPEASHGETFATRAYVIGEIVIAIVVLVGSGLLLYASGDQSVKTVAASTIVLVTGFWFQRRASEQASNAVTTLANGKLTAVLDAQSATQQRMDGLVTTVARIAATSGKEGASS